MTRYIQLFTHYRILGGFAAAAADINVNRRKGFALTRFPQQSRFRIVREAISPRKENTQNIYNAQIESLK